MVNATLKTQLPLPYGTIPKRSSKKNMMSPTKKLPAPYPLKPDTSFSFFSLFYRLFSDDHLKDPTGPVGFMPCITSSTQTQTSPFDVIVPVSSSPIDCSYGSQEHDSSSSYSTSTSSSTSSTSSSSSSDHSLSSYMEQEEHPIKTNTTSALSDILCDHYVQTKQTPPSSSDSELINVPLETFRIFEAPPTEEHYWETSSDREWTLVETLLSKPSKKPQKTVVPKIETPVVQSFHERDVRANAAYLRMIVAEVNMMRSQKIIGPLRPRRVLPKRTDRFMHRPSPLQLVLV